MKAKRDKTKLPREKFGTGMHLRDGGPESGGE